MAWYYMDGQERLGPLEDAEFEARVSTGEVTSQTHVWRPGMAQWQTYGVVVQAAGRPAVAGATFPCAECGRVFPADEMVSYGDLHVCAACKPVFFQRIKEGAPLPGTVAYGGFWIRFAAKFLDGVILGVVSGVIAAVNGVLTQTASPETALTIMMLNWVIGMAIGIGYATFFVGKFGATPGKMACGLKIIMADGGRVTYMRAFGRFFAEYLSMLIFYIGYIMAAFDDEKRTLHDRVCDTRVIRSRT